MNGLTNIHVRELLSLEGLLILYHFKDFPYVTGIVVKEEI